MEKRGSEKGQGAADVEAMGKKCGRKEWSRQMCRRDKG
jgi:hypothetical protein